MDPNDTITVTDSTSCHPDRLLEGDVVKMLPDSLVADSLSEVER
jgi:hypothetical protein